MNPELQNKRTFAASLDVGAVVGQFRDIGRFESSVTEAEARIALASMKCKDLKKLLKLYSWNSGGNISQKTARLMENWARVRMIERTGQDELRKWKNAQLDQHAIAIGLSTIGNKENKVARLVNWARRSRHEIRFKLANEIQMYALNDALRERRPVSPELAKEWGIASAIETYGYALSDGLYRHTGRMPDVYEVDEKPASLETLNRLTEETKVKVESWTKGVSGWESRLVQYFQESCDETLSVDMTQESDKARGMESELRFQFSGRHIGTSFKGLADARRELHLATARLRYLEGVRLTETKPPQAIEQPELL